MVRKKPSRPKVVIIGGPTASGKTALGLKIARKFKGEIISADSRQLYKGTDIASDIIKGKWTGRGKDRKYVAKGVPHHLTAILDLDQHISAAEYKILATEKIDEVLKRDRLPIIVGGTGLYIRAIADNLTIPEVPPDPKLRKQLESKTTRQLFAMLRRQDAVYAARISSNNRRYMIRALEVIQATGAPFSAVQGKGRPLYDFLQIGITRPREELYSRIEVRVDEQIKEGMIKEARRLSQRYGWEVPPMSALGHKQLKGYLEGKISLEEAVRLIKRDVKRYARRQLTWFRRDHRIHWVKDASEAEKLVTRFVHELGLNKPKKALI